MPCNILRFLRTVHYLRKKQIIYYILNPFRKNLYALINKRTRDEDINWKPLIIKTKFLTKRGISAEEIKKRRFCFINERYDFENQIDWHFKKSSRLWRYNLHYFDYLHPDHSFTTNDALFLIKDWIAKNPIGSPDAWDIFPTSLRVVNWIKFLNENQIQSNDILSSLFTQIRWIYKNLEYHLFGNHLFKNIKAIIFGGVFFEGKEAQNWLKKGINLLEKELNEQILPDGGHFERSPMYHSMILEDCLDLINILGNKSFIDDTQILESLKFKARKMLAFLQGMTHPDGGITLFNDSAFGIEPELKDLKTYYKSITGEKIIKEKKKLISFPDTGYFIISPNEDNKLIIDCGSIGPDYLPGHSHCDTLSFELSLKGKRVIVDSGCFGYEDGEIRQYNRGNVGHNTLTIDGQNQSEVWGSHRCGMRAYPIYSELKEEKDGILVFKGAHNGYLRLKGKPIHYRHFIWSEKTIKIEDHIEGEGIHDIELGLHINPEFKIRPNGESAEIINSDGRIIARIFPKKGPLQEKKGWYCPEFGLKKDCSVLFINHKKIKLPYETGWRIEIGN